MGEYMERGRKSPHAILSGEPPAIVLIKEDHQMFRALFDRAQEEDGPALFSLAGEICVRLAIHMTLEEDILYPALKLAIGAGKIDEGIVEHDLAKTLIVDLVHMTGREERYKSKVHVLGEEVMHHIEEEDRGLLADARMAWEQGKVDLPIVCRQMLKRRHQLYDAITAMGSGCEPEIEPVGDEIEEYASGAPTGLEGAGGIR
ncbi:MAG TPA: hemerythrin domain-containing protein [Allosphingosinicella sp.]|nr:hemerythrin domain-containing protein [Allosphingosinicella sp.]